MNEKLIKNNMEELLTFMCYSGYFSQKAIVALIESLEVQSLDVNLNQSVSKKLYIAFIELFQNIMKYSTKDYTQNCNTESIVIQHDEESYYVTATNNIDEKAKTKVKFTLDEIGMLDKSALNKRFNELRKSGEKTHDNGGGIGFYQIAKKASGIMYSIKKINDNVFQLKIIVKIDKA
jgi:hypothetical protein